MKRLFINEVDFSNRVEIDLSFVEKLDRELDEGYFTIPHTSRRTPFAMFDIVDIYEDQTLIFSGRVARDVVNISSFNDRLFNHEINIIEHTKILERYTVKGKSNTQPIDKTLAPVETLLDVVDKLRKTTPLEIVGLETSFRPFRIPQETAEILDEFIAPEFNFKDLTLRQALDQIANVVDSIVRLDRGGNLTLTQFDKLKNKISFVEQSFRQELDVNDYATTLESEALNIVDVEGYESNNNIIEIYPGEGAYTTLRSTDYLFNFSNNTHIPTKRPIYEVHDVKVVLQIVLNKNDADPLTAENIFAGNLEISIANRVLQKELWDSLDPQRNQNSIDLQTVGKFFKNNTIYYNYARKNIFVGELFGLFEVNDVFPNLLKVAALEYFINEGIIPPEVINTDVVDNNGDVWTLNILNTFGNNITNNGDLLCRVYYTPITSAITYQIHRDNIEEINFYSELTTNQQTRIVDASRFANNLKGRVNKMGGSERTVSHRVGSYNETFNIGDFVEDDGLFVITKKEVIIHRDYYVVNYELTRNFNKFSQFVGIDSEIRQYETGKTDRTVERDLVYGEFVEITPSSGGEASFDSLTLADNEKVLRTLDSNFNHSPLNSCLVTTDVKDDYFIVGLNKSAGGNALSFNFEFEDNIIAGIQNKSDEGWWIFQRRFNEPLPYADSLARFETMEVKIYDKQLYNTSSLLGEINDITERNQAYSLLRDLAHDAPQLLEANLPSDPYIDGEWYVAKDNREVIKFNLMYHFLPTNVNELIVGNKFAEQNGLIKEGNNNVQLWIYNNRKFDISDKNKSLEAPDTVITSPNLTFDTANSKIIVNDQLSQGQSYALVNDEGFPYIMVNSDKNHLLFNFRNKRNGIQYLGITPVFVFAEAEAKTFGELVFTKIPPIELTSDTIANAESIVTPYEPLSITSETISSGEINFTPSVLPPPITATFDSAGGTPTFASQSGQSPLTVTDPGSPTRSGFVFAGWSPSLPTTITQNTTFTAQWTEIAIRPQFTNESSTQTTITFRLRNDDASTAELFYREKNVGSYISAGNIASGASTGDITITGLSSATQYTFEAFARVSGKVDSPTRELVIFTEAPPLITNTPSINITDVTQTSVTYAVGNSDTQQATIESRIVGVTQFADDIRTGIGSGAVTTFTVTGLSPGTNYTIEARATATGKTVSATASQAFNTVLITVRAKTETEIFTEGTPILWEFDGNNYSQSGQTNLNADTYTVLRSDVPTNTLLTVLAVSSFVYNNQTFTFNRWRVGGILQSIGFEEITTTITQNTDLEALYDLTSSGGGESGGNDGGGDPGGGGGGSDLPSFG